MADFRYPSRVENLRALLREPIKIDEEKNDPPPGALIVTHVPNARYLTGFTGSNALVLLTEDQAVFFTDSRYDLQSAVEVPGWERVVLGPGTIMAEAVAETIKARGIGRAGFESAHITYNEYQTLAKAVGDAAVLVSCKDLVERVRLVKDANEIAAIRAAVAVVDDCFTFMRGMIRPGMTEKAVAWEMELFMRGRGGAQRLGFDSIVGSGPNSALIHGRPTDRAIGSSGAPEFLLCDFGCELDGYCADITRTFIVNGAPTPAQRALYDTVAEALDRSLSMIRPGVAGKDVDAAVSEFLKARGYGELQHGLGHSLGRVVHDGHMFGKRSETILAPGMVGTVEPGLYVEGLGGVRIEDDILVTPTGCEILTRSSKDLIVLEN